MNTFLLVLFFFLMVGEAVKEGAFLLSEDDLFRIGSKAAGLDSN
jgi:hypothetical protein